MAWLGPVHLGLEAVWYVQLLLTNRPISQIPQCTSSISHNAPFCNRNVHMCAHFCYKMGHCGILIRCIMGSVRWVYYIEAWTLTDTVFDCYNLGSTHWGWDKMANILQMTYLNAVYWYMHHSASMCYKVAELFSENTKIVLPIDIENPYRLSNCLYR